MLLKIGPALLEHKLAVYKGQKNCIHFIPIIALLEIYPKRIIQ